MKRLINKLDALLLKRCPKSGRIVGLKSSGLSRVLFPFLGIAAIIWFLVRVIPKPSRATYPCQQIAAGIGGTFLLYLFGAISSLALYEQIRKRFNKRIALTYFTALVCVVSIGFGIAEVVETPFVPVISTPDAANTPIGEAKGMNPGRVAWTQDFDATSWDGKTGSWWDDNNTNQAEALKMMSVTLRNLTGAKTDAKAWQKLFEYNNMQNGRGKKGYSKGEKIVIKINMNAIRKETDHWRNQGYPSPHMMYALISQLIETAGVSGEDIIITDPSRQIGPEITDKIRANQSTEFQSVWIEENKARNQKGYQTAEPDTTALVWFNMPDGSKYRMCFPKSFSDATYIINYALVRPHRVFGITSAAKNHFGSVYAFDLKGFKPNKLHAFALWDYPTPNKMGDPHSAPVLLGHKLLNSKTFLYLADGLYAAINQGGAIQRMASFNDDWFSSLMMSQDPVALESVVYDFIRNEPNLVAQNPSFNGNLDNQFHECALANNPPSGIKYDPENDGTGLQSLGVHEHWNNAKERKYSRNLGRKVGIELVSTHL